MRRTCACVCAVGARAFPLRRQLKEAASLLVFGAAEAKESHFPISLLALSPVPGRARASTPTPTDAPRASDTPRPPLVTSACVACPAERAPHPRARSRASGGRERGKSVGPEERALEPVGPRIPADFPAPGPHTPTAPPTRPTDAPGHGPVDVPGGPGAAGPGLPGGVRVSFRGERAKGTPAPAPARPPPPPPPASPSSSPSHACPHTCPRAHPPCLTAHPPHPAAPWPATPPAAWPKTRPPPFSAPFSGAPAAAASPASARPWPPRPAASPLPRSARRSTGRPPAACGAGTAPPSVARTPGRARPARARFAAGEEGR